MSQPTPLPFADEWTDDYALYVADHGRVGFSPAIRTFLGDCQLQSRRPVLLTSPQAQLSLPLVHILRAAGAKWAVNFGDAVVDAVSGRCLESFTDLWRPELLAERPVRMGYLAPRPQAQTGVFFDAYLRERADDRTQLGAATLDLLDGFGAAAPTRWGTIEPRTNSWSSTQLTASMRAQMPVSEVHMLAGDDADSTISVSRTPDGLLQHITGTVVTPELSAATPAEPQWQRVTAALTGLAQRHRPTLAFVSRTEMTRLQDGSYGQSPGLRAHDQPLAALLGPRAVRDLGIDFESLGRKHDIVPIGPGRVASALVRFTEKTELWHQLLAFAHDLDPQRLAATVGPVLNSTNLGGDGGN